jgi:drug/metabolite transporter (DMT)-like permease
MLKRKNLTFKIFLFLIFIDLLETFAQFCFKKSVLAVNGFEIQIPHDILHFIIKVAPSPYLWFGLFSVILIFAIWSTILSKIDLSVAVPICSFSYITVPLVSLVFLHEKISTLRWFGIFIILLGVVLVAVSSNQKEKAQ